MKIEEQKKKRKKTRNVVLALMVLLAVVWWGITLVSSSSGLGCNLENYRTETLSLLREWDDAAALANQTPRMSLPARIADLQSIRRRADSLKVNSCFADAHSFLIKYMDYTIEGFTAFMSKESDYAVQSKFSMAETYFETWLLRLMD